MKHVFHTMSLHARRKGVVRIPDTLPALFVLTCTLASAQTLIWSEEFNYTSTPDSDVWSYDLGDHGWGNAELQDYTSNTNNVWVDGSNLVVTARRLGNSFSSGRIKTQDKLTFKYGTIEARIQTPDLANGLWPAFWTLGNDFPSAGWPECGEIDIMEMGIGGAIGDGVVNQRVGSHFHWDANGYRNEGASYNMPSPINDTFVVCRMEWTPTQIKTYINGEPIAAKETSAIPEFNEPHFFLLNMAVGGTYTGIFDAGGITASFPAEYRVDWIRIYDNGHTVLGGSSTVAPPTPGTNLLENPGFESGMTGWAPGLSGGSATALSAYAHAGSHALLIDSTGAGGWSSPNLSQSVTASPGDVFRMQGYMLNPSGDPIAGGSFGLFKMEFRDSGGSVLEPTSVDVGTSAASPYYGAESVPKLNASSTTDTWTFSAVQAEAPAGTEEVRFVVLNVNQPGNPGCMYFDDIEAVLLGGGSNAPPAFSSDPVVKANATEDAPYTGQTVLGAASDPEGGALSYSLLPGGPSWLGIASDGTLSGMPGNADVGINSWAVQVSDGTNTASAMLYITVDNVNDAPVFTANPISSPDACAGRAYSETIAGSATDEDLEAALSYSLLPGGPSWLDVAANGALSGRPGIGDLGTNSWSVQVSDGVDSNTATLAIWVEANVTGTRVLENPGFESGTDRWDVNLSGGSASASAAYAHGGSHALLIDSTGAGGWASPNASQSLAAAPGDVFNVQGYMLNPSSAPINGSSFGLFKVEFRDSGGTVLEPVSVDVGTSAAAPYYGAESAPRLNASSAADTWIFSEVQAEAPAGTAMVGFYILNVNQPGNPGPMYFDDVDVKLIGDPLPVTLNTSMAGGNMQISFPTQDGFIYQLVYKNSLTDTSWGAVETIPGNGSTNSFSYPTTDPAGFYRVLSF